MVKVQTVRTHDGTMIAQTTPYSSNNIHHWNRDEIYHNEELVVLKVSGRLVEWKCRNHKAKKLTATVAHKYLCFRVRIVVNKKATNCKHKDEADRRRMDCRSGIDYCKR